MCCGRDGRSGPPSTLCWISAGPAKVELCVLIDRRFTRQLPIQADYIGKPIDSMLTQKVKVYWKEKDGKDEVALV